MARVSAGPDQVHVRLLATTDLHAHLLPFDYFTDIQTPGVGLAGLADLIVAARAGAPNTLLFDNGDTLQGTPLADTILAEILPKGSPNPMVAAMNALGFDAATVGNHDFDFGLDYLETSLAAAQYGMCVANVHRPDGSPFLPQRQMLQKTVSDGSNRKKELRIGVTGAVPPQIAAWSKRWVEGKLVFSDITESIAEQAALLRAEGADLVVALTHCGTGRADASAGEENVAKRIAGLADVDAVIAGHTHDLVADAETPDFAPIVQPAAYGTHLGLIDLLLTPKSGDVGWTVGVAQVATPAVPDLRCAKSPRLREVLRSHPVLRKQVAQVHRTTRTHVDSPLGHSAVPLETLFSTLAPCAATQLVADAQRAAAAPMLAAHPELTDLPVLSAAAPFRAGGRAGASNYTDIPAGALKFRHAADLYIYPNALCVVRIDGAGVLEWLERCVSIYRQIDPDASGPQPLIDHAFAPYNYDRITGLRYRIDITQPPRTDAEGGRVDRSTSRIRDLRFADGRPVRPTDQMLVITNSYRAAGGGHVPSAAAAETLLSSSDTVRDAVARYIANSEAALAPLIEPTFSFEPRGQADLIYETSPAAYRYPGRLADLRLTPAAAERSTNGFAQFRVIG